MKKKQLREMIMHQQDQIYALRKQIKSALLLPEIDSARLDRLEKKGAGFNERIADLVTKFKHEESWRQGQHKQLVEYIAKLEKKFDERVKKMETNVGNLMSRISAVLSNMFEKASDK